MLKYVGGICSSGKIFKRRSHIFNDSVGTPMFIRQCDLDSMLKSNYHFLFSIPSVLTAFWFQLHDSAMSWNADLQKVCTQRQEKEASQWQSDGISVVDLIFGWYVAGFCQTNTDTVAMERALLGICEAEIWCAIMSARVHFCRIFSANSNTCKELIMEESTAWQSFCFTVQLTVEDDKICAIGLFW